LSLGTLIEFYFKLIICITIPEEPYLLNLAMIETAHLPESAQNLYLFLPDPDT
jgi:hypothetical protein